MNQPLGRRTCVWRCNLIVRSRDNRGLASDIRHKVSAAALGLAEFPGVHWVSKK